MAKSTLLKSLFISTFAFMGFAAQAEEEPAVVLDFSTNGWEFPVGSTNKGQGEKEFTSDGITIKISTGTGSKDSYYFNTSGYFLFGQSGARITLPAFDFEVDKIVSIGNSGASGSTKQNIYVGDVAVSNETAGSNVNQTYYITDAYQAAGNLYSFQVGSAHNCQIKGLHIYKKDASSISRPEF